TTPVRRPCPTRRSSDLPSRARSGSGRGRRAPARWRRATEAVRAARARAAPALPPLSGWTDERLPCGTTVANRRPQAQGALSEDRSEEHTSELQSRVELV